MIRNFPHRKILEIYVRFKVRRTASALDIGAGIRPCPWFTPWTHVVIEPHQEYVERLREMRPDIIALTGTAQEKLPDIESKSLDSVFLLDVLEHLPKYDGLSVLNHAIRIAREQVVIFTPLGFFRQDEEEIDGWGMHGGHWQAHLSGWVPEELAALGFDAYVCSNYHSVDAHGNRLPTPQGAFYAIKDIRSMVEE